ncbi:MAG: ABC transporter ATP-binding protein, partial [Bacteroidetes bacterium]|nr:ABC transporter ATP-binding protein [Fibrella sp.]
FSRDVLFIGFSLWLLARLNPELTLIVAASLPVFAGLIVLANRHLRENTKRRRDIRVSNLSFVNSRLSALTTIKVLNRHRVEENIFNQRSRQLLKAGQHYYVTQSFVDALLPVTLYGLLAVVLVAVYHISLRNSGAISGSVVITFILLLIYLRPVLRRLLRVNGVWQSGNLSFTTAIHLLSQGTEVRGSELEFSLIKGEIQVENLTYRYDTADEPILRNLSFSARPGQITKLAGKQGSGKSTVFRLLMRLYRPQDGRILVDGQDIAHASVDAYRKHITLVSEEVPLLGKTAYEAVVYRRKPATRKRVAALLPLVYTALNQQFTFNLNDEIGELGANLSAGQRRVLMLTRALLTNKPVLLFDEPFNGLDEAGRQGLARLLNQLADEGHAVLVIDHHDTPGLNVGQTITLTAEPAPSPTVQLEPAV